MGQCLARPNDESVVATEATRAPAGAAPVSLGAAHEARDGRPRPVRKPDRWIILTAFVVAAVVCLAGEKIDACNGLGWDGCVYGAMALNPRREIVDTGWDASRIRRIGPAIVANVALKLSIGQIRAEHVVQAFTIANVLMITLACGLVVKTLDVLGAGPRSKWVAFLALALSYCVAKWVAWYPVLTDMPGLTLGAALLYGYVRRQRAVLFILTFIAGFTWHAAYYQGLILTIWEPFRPAPTIGAPAGSSRPERVATVLAAGLALGFAAYSLYLVSPGQFTTVRFLAHEPMWELLPLSVAVAAAYVFFGSWPYLRAALPDVGRSILRVVVHPNTWLALLVLVVGVQAIVLRLAEESAGVEAIVYPHMVASAIDRPGVFFLAHAVFFGPIVILAAYAWPRICRLAAALGPGATISLGLLLALSIGSETRREVNFLPLLVVLTVLAVDVEAWPWWAVAAFGALCAVTSKIWYPIGPLAHDDSLRYRVLMNLGPFMELDAYLIQLGGLIVVVAVLAAVWWQSRRRTGQIAPASAAPHGVPAG